MPIVLCRARVSQSARVYNVAQRGAGNGFKGNRTSRWSDRPRIRETVMSVNSLDPSKTVYFHQNEANRVIVPRIVKWLCVP